MATSMADLMAQMDKKTLKVQRGDSVTGKIILLSENEVVVDLGGKNEGVLDKTLDMYFYLPNFLLSIAEGEKQVAKLTSNYADKIDNEFEEAKNYVKNKEEILTERVVETDDDKYGEKS